ncbi:hypothetical protein [Novosphingobium sp. FKTRR1]|uniref:hypothetical protein n=1 Tax=Novosphingobium sp. FKTRR1 TaxID=2879118 RepID=UPI001CF0836E|nr:hypothetical protein [Novosphingobium sp. FKTRR1]
MSMSECVKGLVAEGAIRKDQGEKAEALYERHFNRLKHEKGMMAAASEATELTMKHLRGEAKAAKRAKISTAMAQVNALKDMRTYAGGMGEGGLFDPRSLTSLAAWDDKARFMDLEGQHEALRATYHSTLDSMLRETRAKVLGKVRAPALEEDILAAAYGEKVDDVNAVEMATAAKKVAELARQQFNEAGGHIAAREDWHWVQDHSGDKFQRAGFDQWKADVMGADERGVPILNTSTMLDNATGLPFEGQAFEDVLAKMYDDVVTDGRANMVIGGMGEGKALYNRHAEERFFAFTDSKTHLWYAQKYGKTGMVEGMSRHLDRMARDVAAMQRFGANPDATIKHVGDAVIAQAARKVGREPKPRAKLLENPVAAVKQTFAPDAVDRAQAAASELQAMYDVFMGKHDNMIPKSRRVAAGFDAFRAFETSAKLGGAFWSAAPGDMATSSVTRSFNGLPQWSMVGDYIRMLAPTEDSLAQRQMLIRHGAMASDWAHSGAEAHRMMGEEFSGEAAKRLAELTIRASALAKHTDVSRQLFVKGFNAGIADFAELPFEKLDPKFSAAINRYGIGSAEWDKIRATPLEPAHGTQWFNPMAIEDTAVRDAYLRMVHTEKKFAVPETDLRTRAMLAENFKRGSVFGETMKTLFLFKGFGLTLMNTHGRRALGQGGFAGARFLAAYAVRMGILTTLAGAAAIQIKNLLRGQDVEPMDNPAFVGRAVAQGGGFGIFGDFLKASENRFGGGIAQTIAGPGASTLGNAIDLTYGNAAAAVRGDTPHVGKDIVKIMRQEVPVASSLWYLRPAYDRLLVHEIDSVINPNHDQDEARLLERYQDQRAPMFVPPGTLLPVRAPDWGNAFDTPGAPENKEAKARQQAKAEAEAAAAM